MNLLLLAADQGNGNGWIMWVIIAVVLVVMIVLTIVPQKKRQKEQQKMMDSLTVGTKLMTVGGILGKITQVNTDNTLIVNVGTELNPTLIVIDRKAVGYVLEAVAAPAADTAADAPAETGEVVDAPADEAPVEVNEKTEGAESTDAAAVDTAEDETK